MNFLDYYSKKRKEIEKALNSYIEEEENEYIRQLLSYVIGGKHFRGTLTLLISDLLDGDKEKALRYACIVEMIQSASLAHDDVIDVDVVRRGKPALWTIASDLVKHKSIVKDIIHGFEDKVLATINVYLKRKTIPIAVLTGDALIMKAMEIAEEEIRNEVIRVIKYMLIGVCYEVLKDENEYYFWQCIKGKTASLFRFSTWLGWLAAEKPDYPITEFGEKLGILYQLTDEFIDEGLPSFISKEEIKKIYDEVINLIEKMPKNKYRDILMEVPNFMIEKLAAETGKEDEIRKIIRGE